MDRVSSLPDELLCHILSFLPTKQAVVTSVLSKRWLNLFALVPSLDINDFVFLHPEEDKRDRVELKQSFMYFVDRVLALQGDSPIKKFSLNCLTVFDSNRVDGWISNVLARGVSDLDLCILFEAYQLSPKCFQSWKLVKLTIGYGIDICCLAGSIFLPMLETLVLELVELYVDKFEILLRAMPVLEELVLDYVIWIDWDVTLSSASLKTLTIYSSDGSNPLSFDTPGLVYFEYDAYLASDYPVVNMENLIDARIIFSLTENQLERAREPVIDWLEEDEDNDALAFSNVWKLFHGLRIVPHLYLSPDTLEVLSLCCESMPVFNNLKLLNIRSEEGRGWQAMPVLLKNCPHLETLVLKCLLHFVTGKCGDACDCIYREDRGRSLRSCPVKKLQIKGFRGTMREKGMIKHFLDSLQCLKEMEIYAEENEATDIQVPKVFELLMIFDRFYTFDIQFFVRRSLYKK